MPTQINMAAAFGIVSAFVWSLFALAAASLPAQLQIISGVDGATHLQTAQPLVLGIGYTEGLIWITCIAAVVGSLLAQVDFEFNEV